MNPNELTRWALPASAGVNNTGGHGRQHWTHGTQNPDRRTKHCCRLQLPLLPHAPPHTPPLAPYHLPRLPPCPHAPTCPAAYICHYGIPFMPYIHLAIPCPTYLLFLPAFPCTRICLPSTPATPLPALLRAPYLRMPTPFYSA